MSNVCKEVTINGNEYVLKEEKKYSEDFVIVRSQGAGVFAGYLIEKSRENKVVVLNRCIRLWRWTGFSLSQVALEGTAGTGENKFSLPTEHHEITGYLEIIPTTELARKKIEAVAPCKM